MAPAPVTPGGPPRPAITPDAGSHLCRTRRGSKRPSVCKPDDLRELLDLTFQQLLDLTFQSLKRQKEFYNVDGNAVRINPQPDA
jgi:hypothetical protein